ncbi:zinc finger MYND domain-containing protein [Phanerochaete sordida]|uniref:Zinc finger MYND domain-containing protein n=1 Tax=Phanerochaete sordida TaxID=48140 RepID=A0A9P3GQC4_9APHY|nr:zinc finger MYND domain-containing protein [Phanerochaete sordida]
MNAQLSSNAQLASIFLQSGFPPNGADVDLVAATKHVDSDYQPDMRRQTHGAPPASPNTCSRYGQPGCPSVADTALHRCSKCSRSYYCCTKCQRLDWPRHKKHCVSPSNESITPSVLLNAARRFGEDNELIQILAGFAVIFLGAEHNRGLGLQRTIIVYCTTFPNIANEAQRVLQLHRVSFERRDEDLKDVFYEAATGNDAFYITFKFWSRDNEYEYSTRVNINHNDISNASRRFQECPIFLLVSLNRMIWNDVHNVYGLRIPA